MLVGVGPVRRVRAGQVRSGRPSSDEAGAEAREQGRWGGAAMSAARKILCVSGGGQHSIYAISARCFLSAHGRAFLYIDCVQQPHPMNDL